jgi:hypothetical protein
MRSDHLSHEVSWVTTYLAQGRDCVKMKIIFSLYRHVNFHLSDVTERKAFVEKPDKRAHGAACVVVFCLAEQERGSPFDIAEINVVTK